MIVAKKYAECDKIESLPNTPTVRGGRKKRMDLRVND